MLRNYFVVIFRSILKNKLFSFVHIFGLAMGLACAFILFMIIQTEYDYDRFHEKRARIYILRKTIQFETGTYTPERTGDAFGPQMLSVYPEIEKACRFRNPGELLFSVHTSDDKDISFLEKNGAAVDSAFFEIFTFPMITGNPISALTGKYNIVLTKSMAEKIFSSLDVMGKEIRINDEYNFVVTGIIEDVPNNSHLKFDFLFSYEFLPEMGIDLQYYEGTRTQNIFLLHKDADPEKINDVLSEQMLEWFEPDIETKAFIYPFSKIHLYGESLNFKIMLIFSIIGILILVIASINYTNLSTARFAARTKEIGIRKTIGADRSKLFWQFMGESLFNSFIAMDLALLMTELGLPFVNSYFESELAISFGQLSTWISIVGLILFTGILAGIYPALIMSSFKPVNVLKNPFIQGFRGFKLRRILVAVQFSLAVAFITTAIFLVRQFEHLKSSEPGYRKENILYFQTKGLIWENYNDFSNALQSIPEVEFVSSASSLPTEIGLGEFEWGLIDEHQSSLAMVYWADAGFPDLFEIEMAEGSFYKEMGSTDCEGGIVINSRMQNYLQLENPIGEAFYLYHTRYTIIGVIDDFEFFPLNLTDQLLIIPYSRVGDFIFVSHKPGDQQAITAKIEKVYKEYNPAFPFEYKFLSDYELAMDRAFKRTTPFLGFFTFLSIFISLLGLFGLTAFSTAQKVKEIGIRKTFGASMMQIVLRFSFQFAKPVIISVVIGFAIAYVVLNSLLNYFNNRTPLHWWVFLIVGIGVILVAQLTVIGHAIKSSRQQPVDCLRYE